jgi:small ligand-binding sensory domain FIST
MALVPHARTAGVAVSADPDPRRAGRLAAAEAASVPGRERVRTVFVFASGAHARDSVSVAEGARAHLPEATVVVVGGAGVVSPERVTSGQAAVSALALAAPCEVATSAAPASQDDAARVGEALGARLRSSAPRPMLLFAPPRAGSNDLVSSFERASAASVVVGGGIAPDTLAAVARAGHAPEPAGAVVAIRLDGGVRASVGASLAVKQLGDLAPVESIERGFVTRVGGRKPLELLTETMRGRRDRPLALVLVEPADARDAEDARVRTLVRGIGGVSPQKGAIHIGDEIAVGDRIAFAILDASAAREDFQSMLRDVERHLAGGIPVAGIYLDCAARGTRLYGRPDVDVRAVASRFPELPFAGACSSFEIAPIGGRARVLAYTGVLTILYAPS